MWTVVPLLLHHVLIHWRYSVMIGSHCSLFLWAKNSLAAQVIWLAAEAFWCQMCEGEVLGYHCSSRWCNISQWDGKMWNGAPIADSLCISVLYGILILSNRNKLVLSFSGLCHCLLVYNWFQTKLSKEDCGVVNLKGKVLHIPAVVFIHDTLDDRRCAAQKQALCTYLQKSPTGLVCSYSNVTRVSASTSSQGSSLQNPTSRCEDWGGGGNSPSDRFWTLPCTLILCSHCP